MSDSTNGTNTMDLQVSARGLEALTKEIRPDANRYRSDGSWLARDHPGAV